MPDSNNANDLEKSFDAAGSKNESANHQNDNQDTHQGDQAGKGDQSSDAEQIDYKKKFAASTTENQRLMREQEAKDAEIERLRILAEGRDNSKNSADHGDNSGQGNDAEESLYPGFEELDPEAQQNLLNYTKAVEDRVMKSIYKDPAISHARSSYNEKRWADAFDKVSQKFPDLAGKSTEFKEKFYQPNKEVPTNIESIMEGMAKIYLFDTQEKKQAQGESERDTDRIDTERTHGGDKIPTSGRTLEDWEHMATNDPVKFAKLQKEYDADMAAGKLKA